jgi:DNA-binding transcriptional LysR family regulator
MALAATGYGIGVLPSTVRIPGSGVVAVPLVQHGAALGRWLTAAWNRQRFLAPYAEQFVEELAAYCRRGYPGHEFRNRVPPFARPNGAEG